MALSVLPANVTVQFEEVSHPSIPSGGTFQNDGKYTDTRYFKCAWSERNELALQLLGGVSSSNGASLFTLPAPHPDISWARVVSVGPMKPFGKPSSEGPYVKWPEAILTVNYSSGDGELTEDQEGNTPYLREEFTGSSETISLPGQYFWNAIDGGVQENPLPQAAAPARTIRGVAWQLTWLRLATLPSAFLDLVGTCNDAMISSRRFGISFAAETLLYGEPQIGATYNYDGSYALTATLSLKYRKTGWNKFFGKPGDEATANPIYAQGGNTPLKPIELASFSPLYNIS